MQFNIDSTEVLSIATAGTIIFLIFGFFPFGLVLFILSLSLGILYFQFKISKVNMVYIGVYVFVATLCVLITLSLIGVGVIILTDESIIVSLALTMLVIGSFSLDDFVQDKVIMETQLLKHTVRYFLYITTFTFFIGLLYFNMLTYYSH